MTNFWASKPGFHKFFCWRYKKASRLLKKNEVSIDSFRKILSAVHVEGETRTVYSNIYDLNKGFIYVYNQHDFDNVVVINIKDEFNKGERVIKFSSIFPSASDQNSNMK